jgi:hypothetical protein
MAREKKNKKVVLIKDKINHKLDKVKIKKESMKKKKFHNNSNIKNNNNNSKTKVVVYGLHSLVAVPLTTKLNLNKKSKKA